jgi:hypothetical protein
VPPTFRGWLVAALSAAAAWFYGVAELDRVLFVAGLAGLALVLVSSLIVGLTGLYLWRRLKPQPGPTRNLEAGPPLRTGFRVPALGGLPLVQIRWEWLQPPGVEVRPRLQRGVLIEEVVASRRAQLPQVRRRLSVRDAFGLSRVAWDIAEPAPVTILPNVGRLRNMPVVQSMAGGEGVPHPSGAPEGDRMDIRRYVPGDSVRNIMWKVYARTRQLNVRTPERAIARARKTVAYLATGPGDEPAAAAARVAVETGVLGQKWLFGADGASEPTDSPERALLAIARSGSIDPASEAAEHGLKSFLEQAAADGPIHCIVFAPARPGAWLRGVLEALRRHPGSVSLVLGTDGVVRRTSRPLWQRMLWAEGSASGTPAVELAALLRKISVAGADALVVDRLSGRPYTHIHQRSLSALQS